MENGRGTGRHDTRQREARRHCDSDSGWWQERDKNSGYHVLPMTSVEAESHEQQQVARRGGWGGRQNQRGQSANRARQRVRGWVARDGDG